MPVKSEPVGPYVTPDRTSGGDGYTGEPELETVSVASKAVMVIPDDCATLLIIAVVANALIAMLAGSALLVRRLAAAAALIAMADGDAFDTTDPPAGASKNQSVKTETSTLVLSPA